MEQNIVVLKSKFKEIKSKGWIEASSNGRGNVGITFEKELGLSPNRSENPDFNGIEIKTKQNNLYKYVTLFSSTFDGPFPFEMKRISENYGMYDEICTGAKVFFGIVRADEFTKIGKKWKFKLEVDYIEKRVYLVVYDNNNVIIDKQSYWSFELLRKRLETKLTYLAFVFAKRKFCHNKVYFLYYDIKWLKLRDFETFLFLLEKGIIRVSFKVGVYRSGPKRGKYYDHGTSFEIQSDDIDCLFYNL